MTASRNQPNRLIDNATLKPEEPCVLSGFFYGSISALNFSFELRVLRALRDFVFDLFASSRRGVRLFHLM